MKVFFLKHFLVIHLHSFDKGFLNFLKVFFKFYYFLFFKNPYFVFKNKF